MKEKLDKIIHGSFYGDFKMVISALKKGANVDTRYRGWTALRWAIQENHIDIVKLLIDSGADIEDVDDIGFTILNTAIGTKNLEIVKILVEKGVDINKITERGVSIITAFAWGSIDIIKYLIEKGADISIADKDGKIPIDYAIDNEHQEIVDYIEEIGKKE